MISTRPRTTTTGRTARRLLLGLILVAVALPGAAGAITTVPALSGATLAPTTFGLRMAWAPTGSSVTGVTIRVVYDTSHRITSPSDGQAVTTVRATSHGYTDTGAFRGHTAHYALFARAGSGYSRPVYLAGRVLPASAATRFQVVYVVPKDVTAVNRVAAIRRDLAAVGGWFARQTGGHRLRFARNSAGRIRVPSLRLTVTRAALQSGANGHDALDDVKRQLGNSTLLTSRSLVVVYVESSSSRGECGVEGGPLAVLWMHSCGGIYPRVSDTFPYGATYLAAHEMTHALGAAPDCARHSTKDGHVSDSYTVQTINGVHARVGRDIIYEAPAGTPFVRDFQHLVLDYHHDDYYGTGSITCPDIAKDAVWTS